MTTDRLKLAVEKATHDLPDLPDGWVWANASDVCSLVTDGTHDTPAYVDEGIPLITSKNLKNKHLDFENVKYIGYRDHIEIRKRSGVERGDILFAMIGTIGNPVVVQTDTDFSIKNVGLFKKNEAVILSEYLRSWLDSNDLDTILRNRELLKGTTQRFIPLGHLRILPVPLAPLAEQGRIVAEIEKQFSRLDAAVAALERLQANLKRYKAAVLKAACEGRLVPQDPDDEPAEKLLERILAERRRKWEEQEWEKLVERAKKKAAQAKRKKAGRPARISDLAPEEWEALPEAAYKAYLPKNQKWKEKYQEPERPDTSELPELPAGWVWATLSQLSWDASYGTSQRCDYKAMGPAVLRIPNIVGGTIDLADIKYSADASLVGEEAKSVRPGDLLIVRTNGSRNLIGRSALVRQLFSKPHFFASYLIRFRVIGEIDLAIWLSAIWDSQYIRNWIERTAATSAGQYNISLGALNSLAVPIPPLSELRDIASEVERRFSLVQEVERAVDFDLRRAERLRQAVLQKAFSGQLVPQDPEDEPASALLARIRAQREKKKSAGKEPHEDTKTAKQMNLL